MIKILTLLTAGSLCLLSKTYAQDGVFNNINFDKITKSGGASQYYGWGVVSNNTLDPRPNSTEGSFMFNNHQGLTFSAHSYYGGIRFYNQGHPIGPYEPSTGAKMVMSINNNAVGIRTTEPRAMLDVGADISGGKLGTVFGRLSEGDNTGDGTFLGVRGYSTTGEYQAKSFALEHSFYGVVNSSINFFRGGNRDGGCISFNTSSNLERMRIDGLGNVGIGTASPNGFKLAVNGNVHAKEIKVDIDAASWPDYVFEEDYKYSSLSDLKTYIKVNKHLPDLPTAKDVEKNGVALGEMNAKLLKKIEEMTLYIINLQEANDTQNKRLEKLEQLISKQN